MPELLRELIARLREDGGRSFSNFISALTKTKVIARVGRTTLGRGGVYALNPKLRSYVERVIACKDEDIPGVTAKE